MQDKKVLVTGGTSGIGEATARAYAAGGADVVITGCDEERGRQIVQSLVRSRRRSDTPEDRRAARRLWSLENQALQKPHRLVLVLKGRSAH